MSEKQSRIFTGILYPDATNYDFEKVITRLGDTFEELAYVTHDLDVTENGELKKLHVHWCGKRKSPAPLSTVSNALQIPPNDIEYCKSWKYCLRYLIHADNPDKVQYDVSKVVANFPFIAVVEGTLNVMKSKQIADYIYEYRPGSLKALSDWCYANRLYDTLMRNFALFNVMLREAQSIDC